MTGLEWLVVTLVVAAATALQAATGAGLGLIAGPVLILALGSTTAVHVAIVLNLLVSIVLLPHELKSVHWPIVRWLSLGTLIGIPLGVWTVNVIDLTTLKLLAGVCVSLAALQLMLARRQRSVTAREAWTPPGVSVGGAVSGWMTGAMAIPGPAAMWQLARSGIPPSAVRACLRAQFSLAYAASLAAHALAGLELRPVAWSTLVLLPALAAGIALGALAKRRLSDRSLANALLVLLVAMGIALLVTGALELAAHDS